MRKFLQILSCILLVLNPISGFLMFASIFTGHWYFVPILISVIYFTLSFYFYMHRIEHARKTIKYNRWKKEFSKTHTYLGITPYYEDEVWKNKLTGEIIEI